MSWRPSAIPGLGLVTTVALAVTALPGAAGYATLPLRSGPLDIREHAAEADRGRPQTNALPLRFTAQAHNLSTAIDMPPQTPLDITIARWSTDGEREGLVTSVKEGGTGGLLDMLRTAERVGAMRIPTSISYDVYFAIRTIGRDGLEHITLITERPIGHWEAVDKPATIEYRFMVLELQMKPGGRGEGRLSVVTKLTADRVTGGIGLETWENQVVTLKKVQRRGQ